LLHSFRNQNILYSRFFRQFLVGNAQGEMAQFDIKRIAASSIVHKYRGAIGSIRSIDTHPTLPLIASVSIDQYLRIHSAETYRQISKVTRFLFLKIE